MADTAVDIDALGASPIVQDLSPDALRALAARGMALELKAGDPLLFQDVRGGLGLFVLLGGEIGVYRRNGGGVEEQLATLSAGDCLGEYSLLDGQPISATARALEASRLFFLPNGQFRTIVAQDASLGCLLYRNLARYLVRRLRAL